MNGYAWLKGVGAAVIIGVLGVLGNGWLSHADDEDLKAEQKERKEEDVKLEKKDEKIVELIAGVQQQIAETSKDLQEQVAENTKINAVQTEVLEQIKEELKDLKD